MDSSLISALAALAGASIGGALSFLGSWVVHKQEMRARWLDHDRVRRQDVYKEFIEEASKCYIHALEHETIDIASGIVLYAKMSRMRVMSSPAVIESAEQVLKQVAEIYSEPAMTLSNEKIRAMLEDGSVDILRKFSEACRAELARLQALGA